jgi:hypothetical protein
MEQLYSAAAPTPVRVEKVTFPDGRYLWVHGLTTAQFASIQARSQRRPTGMPEDRSLTILMQIAASCYAGEEPGSARIFSDLDLEKVGMLTLQEMVLIMAAVQRVNGTDATEQEVLRDFLPQRTEPSSSNSTSSASSVSDGALVK